MKTDTLVDFYNVNDSDHPVKLIVKIGFGQNAISKIVLSGQIITGPERDGSYLRSFEKILGTNKELDGKEFHMTTLVLDNLEDINGTCITISLTGGVANLKEKLEINSSGKGGVVKYSVSIRFLK